MALNIFESPVDQSDDQSAEFWFHNSVSYRSYAASSKDWIRAKVFEMQTKNMGKRPLRTR